MRKRSLTVETSIGPIPASNAKVWAMTYGKVGGTYVSELPSPVIQTTELYGHIRTTSSFLNRFNKNDVCHESYSGYVRLKWKNFSTSSSSSAGVINLLRQHGSLPGKVIYFPLEDGAITLVDSDEFGLLLAFPNSDSTDGDITYWVSGIKYDPKTQRMRAYNLASAPSSSLSSLAASWRDGSLGDNSRRRLKSIPLSKGVDSVGDVDSYLNEIRSSLVYYTRDSIFPLYEVGLDDALGDAVGSADGFHFSRLAAEIAVDGLAVQSLFEIVRLMRKSIQRYSGALRKLTAVLKVLPSAYVGLQYGVLAPLREYAQLPGVLEQHFKPINYSFTGNSVASYDDFTVNTRVSLQAQEPTDQKSLFELTYLLRGGFSLDDLWEVVPFSFVVDWFVNIGNLAESTRFNEIYTKLNIQYATVSRSYERIVNLDINGLHTELKHRIYTREYRKADSLPSHIFSFTWGDIKGSWSTSNVDEATSMILTYFL